MTDIFIEECPTYIVYGMTYDQYWFGDPWMAKAYREAFMLRQKKRNEEMWLQGAYIMNAVSTAIHNNFSNRKSDYLKEPLDIYPKTEAEKREEIRREKLKLVQQLSMISAQFKMKQKGTDQNGNKP